VLMGPQDDRAAASLPHPPDSSRPAAASRAIRNSTAASQLGTPVTITSAIVGPVITDALRIQGLYGFWIVLPAADVAALQAITTTAADARANLDISVAGRAWLLPIPGRPFTNGQLEMFLPSRGNSLPSRNNQVLKLHRILVPPS
jgi:hypothetical protein